MTVNSDWLADEFGDIQPAVATELQNRGAPRRELRAERVQPAQHRQEDHESTPSVLFGLAIFVVALGVGYLGWLGYERFFHHEAVPKSYSAYVAAANVQLRDLPGLDQPVVAILQPNEEVEVFLANAEGWLSVSARGQGGWVYAGLLRGVRSNWLGSAAILKDVTPQTRKGTERFPLGQKLLIEKMGDKPGEVIALLPDGSRVAVPSTWLLFLDSRP